MITNNALAPRVKMQPLWQRVDNDSGHAVDQPTGASQVADVWRERYHTASISARYRIALLVEAGSAEDCAAKDAEIGRLRTALEEITALSDFDIGDTFFDDPEPVKIARAALDAGKVGDGE